MFILILIFQLLLAVFARPKHETGKSTPRTTLDSLLERIGITLTCVFDFFTGRADYFSPRNTCNYLFWTIILVVGCRNIDSWETALYTLCETTIGTLLIVANWYLCEISIFQPRRRITHYTTLLVMLVNYVVLFAAVYHASTMSPFSGAFVFGVIAYSEIAFAHDPNERTRLINIEFIIVFFVGLLFHAIQVLTQTHISMALPLFLFSFWLICDYRHRNRRLYDGNRLLSPPRPNTAKIGCIFYHLDKAAKCAKVIPEDNVYSGICYVGNITIPAQIVYKKTPYKVTEIDNCAFYKSRRLSSVAIPEGVTTIGESAFRDCPGLEWITIPEGVTTIRERAFENCTKLKEITIPKSVTSIEAMAFNECRKLSEIIILSEIPPQIADSAFGPFSPNTTLLVPSSAKESYENTAPWKGFKIIGME